MKCYERMYYDRNRRCKPFPIPYCPWPLIIVPEPHAQYTQHVLGDTRGVFSRAQVDSAHEAFDCVHRQGDEDLGRHLDTQNESMR